MRGLPTKVDEHVAVSSPVGQDVEVDSGYIDSSTGSNQRSPTASMSSSILSFTYSRGRRYHSTRFSRADYFMPNDENEQERLDMYHHIFLLLQNGRLYTAPLETIPIRRVLDAGTGTGIWAIDFADQYPLASVTGTDISPIQPSWVPTNCKFEVDDIEEDWIHSDNYFDYIHMRSLSGAIKDWPRLLEQSYKALVPGGYYEFQDYGCRLFLSDGTPINGYHPEYPSSVYMYHVTSAAERSGRRIDIGHTMKGMLEATGFVDVVEKAEVWPLSGWPKDPRLKELGRWGTLGTIESAYPFALQLLTREGWTVDKIKELADAAISSIQTGGHNVYVLVWFVYGKKPLTT